MINSFATLNTMYIFFIIYLQWKPVSIKAFRPASHYGMLGAPGGQHPVGESQVDSLVGKEFAPVVLRK